MDKNMNALADKISTYCETQVQLIYNENEKKNSDGNTLYPR